MHTLTNQDSPRATGKKDDSDPLVGFTVHLPRSLKRAVARKALDLEITHREILTRALRMWLESSEAAA